MSKTLSNSSSLAWTENCTSKEQKDFFHSTLTRNRSTFGASAKAPDPHIIDDGFTFAAKSIAWTRYKSQGALVARPRITRVLGTLKNAPGPGAYNDRDDLRSKIETAPAFSMTSKRTHTWFSDVIPPGPGSYKAKDHVEPFLEKRGPHHPVLVNGKACERKFAFMCVTLHDSFPMLLSKYGM